MGILSRLLGRAAPLPAPDVAPFLAPLLPELPPPAAPAALVTAELLQALGCNRPEVWAPPLARHCGAEGITSPARVAAFLANLLYDTRGLADMQDLPPDGVAEDAAFDWRMSGCSSAADAGLLATARRRLTGGSRGLAEVLRLYCRARQHMAARAE